MDTVVLKVSQFPPEFKTMDIMAMFPVIPEIKWEDDTTCYCIFDNQQDCRRAYLAGVNNPFAKVEPAELRIERSEPRPVTTDIVARRMIAGALGVKPKTKTQRELEDDREKINRVIEQKKQADRDLEKRKRQLDAAWDE
ncbi:hypothetical protein EDD86DRAFT_276784 [Gorgonomyces haynaldii]|nr:hypothetical protein EDD86DRAFT_276784 [Gorgonomyces haynaldii]